MKKKFLILLIGLFTILKIDVFACGEINELTTDIGKVNVIDSSNYLVTVPEGTNEVTLGGSTDYEWVEGFAPRKVSTHEKQELKVNGNACGYGIYTYFIKFKIEPTTIAENTDNPVQDTNTNTNDTVNDQSQTESGNSNGNQGKVKLKSLTIEGVAFDFNPDTFEYDMIIPSTFDELDIKTSLNEGDFASIVISDNAEKLVEGENKITITVLDTDANVVVYTLNVTKEKLKSSNNYLAGITVQGYPLNFDSSITSYDLSIGKESTLNINVVTESELATYEILNNHNLGNGSSITVRVTAEDGSVRDYIIKISRTFNIMDYWVYIVVGLLVLLLLLLLAIMKQKKSKKIVSGPKEIEASQSTAGVVQEINSANATASIPATDSPAPVMAAPVEGGNLQIIEPTNIESEIKNEQPETEIVETFGTSMSVDEENSPTEVFKL